MVYLSFQVKDICFPVIDDQRWLTNVDNTHWLDHLHHILSGAVKIADKVKVFCGEGDFFPHVKEVL